MPGELVSKRRCGNPVPSRDEDRVVAGHRARDAGMSSLVDRLGERVRIARRSRQDDQVAGRFHSERIPPNRGAEPVLDYCEQQGIGFIPWYPLAAGELARSGSVLDKIAKEHKVAPSQIALAWILKRSPVMLPIPGTSKVKHLEENVAAVEIQLSDSEFASLNKLRA